MMNVEQKISIYLHCV